MIKTFFKLAEAEGMKQKSLELLEKDCNSIAALSHIDIGILCIEIGNGFTDGHVGSFKKWVLEIQTKVIKKKEKKVLMTPPRIRQKVCVVEHSYHSHYQAICLSPVSEPHRSFNSTLWKGYRI